MATIEQASSSKQVQDESQEAFAFIQKTANGLALTPEFYAALIRDFFDRDAQQNPRHYGVNVTKGPHLWHIVSFGGHDRVEKPNGNTSLSISKYDASIITADHDRAYLGKIHAYASWVTVAGVKEFKFGGAKYDDQQTGLPGIEDTKSALSRGRILIEDLINPVRF